MKVLTVYVSTEDDLATAEEVADALHSAATHYGGSFSALDFVVSVDAQVPVTA